MCLEGESAHRRRAQLECGHDACEPCLREWGATHATCPICRAPYAAYFVGEPPTCCFLHESHLSTQHASPAQVRAQAGNNRQVLPLLEDLERQRLARSALVSNSPRRQHDREPLWERAARRGHMAQALAFYSPHRHRAFDPAWERAAERAAQADEGPPSPVRQGRDVREALRQIRHDLQRQRLKHYFQHRKFPHRLW